MRRRRSWLRAWAPVIIGITALALAVAGVAALVSAQEPTHGRAEDVAVFRPPLTGRSPDLIRGDLRREAGCTYLDGRDGRRWIVLFPDLGTRWENDALFVERSRYPLDRSIALRGRVVKIPVSGFRTDIPGDCRPTGFFFLVQV